MRSLTGRPNTHMAGDILVVGSGVFLYCRIASWNASMSMAPSLPTLPVINLLTVLTPTSALQLLCGNATELSRWCSVGHQGGEVHCGSRSMHRRLSSSSPEGPLVPGGRVIGYGVFLW